MAEKTTAREFMEWLVEKVDDTGDDINIRWPKGHEDTAECVDVQKDGKWYSVYVSHTNDLF